MARWRLGFALADIAAQLRMAEQGVQEVIAKHRKPDENDPAPKRLMGRFNK